MRNKTEYRRYVIFDVKSYHNLWQWVANHALSEEKQETAHQMTE